MRFFASTILVLSSFIMYADGVNYIDEIWLDGSTLSSALPTESKNTIYFSTWDPAIDHLRKTGEHRIAIQLDSSFDPFPFDPVRLPTIAALSAVSSRDVLKDYLDFMENFSRTKGVNYLVLPDTTGRSEFEKEVLETAVATAPHFFVHQGVLRKELPTSKKDFMLHVSKSPQILLAPQNANLRKIERWSSKHLPPEHLAFLAQLETPRAFDMISSEELPNELSTRIFDAGSFAIDAQRRLPLIQQEITYLGANEDLRYWLSKYATVYRGRRDGVPVIVDQLTDDGLEAKPGDLVLTMEKRSAVDITQLVFPLKTINQEVQMAKMLFGAAAIRGRNDLARVLPDMNFLGFSKPELEGLSEQFRRGLDSIGSHAIEHYATPGIQLAVVKNGHLVFERSLGTYTYDSIKPVDHHTIYDVASLTKVMATLPAIGLLLDREQINLDDSVGQYLPDFKGSNKGSATIRQLLAHNAGLKSYVPFWSMVMEGDRLDAFYYKNQEDEANDVRSYGYEPDPIMLDSLRSFIVKSDLIKHPKKYNYSDLGFMMLHLIVEAVTDQSFDHFLASEFYSPMGLTNTSFNPLSHGFDANDIAPTEYDQRFRDQLVWGEVHDRNAAVFGGVSGHAGLFSNASDLAKMMSMYLNGGVYGGKRYLSERVLKLFNTRYFEENRRGLGWDKKDGQLDAASRYASDRSFGHTGFTGTMVWADPDQDLIFVFLSNRIYPDAANNRLSRFNVRTLMHDQLYEAVKSTGNLKLN